MPSEKPMRYVLATPLSDRQALLVGLIISEWGAMEHDVFGQTLDTFINEGCERAQLPKEMNNMKFSLVLDLWKKRVLDKAEGRVAEVLQKAYESILFHQDYRNALAHGMWDWDARKPDIVTATRIKKDEIVSVAFSTADLEYLHEKAQDIRFQILSPEGPAQLIGQIMKEEGAYYSHYAPKRNMRPEEYFEQHTPVTGLFGGPPTEEQSHESPDHPGG